MRESKVVAKAGPAIGRAIRGMIRNTMEGFERQLPAPEVHARHAALVEQVAHAKAVQDEAHQRKQERLDQHYARQERRQQRKADRRPRQPVRPKPPE
jgi:hypothetical protein